MVPWCSHGCHSPVTSVPTPTCEHVDQCWECLARRFCFSSIATAAASTAASTGDAMSFMGCVVSSLTADCAPLTRICERFCATRFWLCSGLFVCCCLHADAVAGGMVLRTHQVFVCVCVKWHLGAVVRTTSTTAPSEPLTTTAMTEVTLDAISVAL